LECAVIVIPGLAADDGRDDLISQRDTARAYTVLDEQQNYTASTLGDGDASPPASTLGDGDASPRASRDPGRRDPRPGRPRRFARRPAGRPETPPGQATDAPAAQTPPARPRPRNDPRRTAP
jgi:hypothetical protein